MGIGCSFRYHVQLNRHYFFEIDLIPTLFNFCVLKDSINLLGYRTCFTQGGVNKFDDPEEPNEFEAPLAAYRNGYFGWHGIGGSVMQWDPNLNIGFGYTPTLFQWYDPQNTKAAKLQKIASDCTKNLSSEVPKYITN